MALCAQIIVMILFCFLQDIKSLHIPVAIICLLIFAVFLITGALLWLLGWMYIIKTHKDRSADQNVKIDMMMFIGNILSGYIAYVIYKRDHAQ